MYAVISTRQNKCLKSSYREESKLTLLKKSIFNKNFDWFWITLKKRRKRFASNYKKSSKYFQIKKKIKMNENLETIARIGEVDGK